MFAGLMNPSDKASDLFAQLRAEAAHLRSKDTWLRSAVCGSRNNRSPVSLLVYTVRGLIVVRRSLRIY